MKIAVIGAGFSGLALSYFLLKKNFGVTLFDTEGGASKVAVGLLHPYPGEKGIKSWKADTCLQEALFLIEALEKEFDVRLILSKGIVRLPIDEVQKENLRKAGEENGDVSLLEEGDFLIHSGVTIDTTLYLQTLLKSCGKSSHFTFLQQRIESLTDLQGFDTIVLACGYGIHAFAQHLPCKLKYLKGQVLTLRCEKALPRALLAKGYLAQREDALILGATYEKRFEREDVDIEIAKQTLLPRLDRYFPFYKQSHVTGALSGVRVAHPQRGTPLIGKLKEQLFVMTAMGSKGLLYHTYLAKMLAYAIESKDTSHIESQVNIERI